MEVLWWIFFRKSFYLPIYPRAKVGLHIPAQPIILNTLSKNQHVLQLSAALHGMKSTSVCARLRVVSASQNRCDAAFGPSVKVGVVEGLGRTKKKKKYRAPQIVSERIPATRDCRSTMCSSALMCLAGLLEAKQKCRYKSGRQ